MFNKKELIVNSGQLEKSYILKKNNEEGFSEEFFSNFLKSYDLNNVPDDFESKLSVLTEEEKQKFSEVFNDKLIKKINDFNNFKEQNANNEEKKNLKNEIKKLFFLGFVFFALGQYPSYENIKKIDIKNFDLEKFFVLNPENKRYDSMREIILKIFNNNTPYEYNFNKDSVENAKLDKELPLEASMEINDFFKNFQYIKDPNIIIELDGKKVEIKSDNLKNSKKKLIEIISRKPKLKEKFNEQIHRQLVESDIKNIGNLRKNEKGELIGDCEDVVLKIIEIAARYDVRIYGLTTIMDFGDIKGQPHTFSLELMEKERLRGKDEEVQEEEYFRAGSEYFYRGSTINYGIFKINSIKKEIIKGVLRYGINEKGTVVNIDNSKKILSVELKIKVGAII